MVWTGLFIEGHRLLLPAEDYTREILAKDISILNTIFAEYIRNRFNFTMFGVWSARKQGKPSIKS